MFSGCHFAPQNVELWAYSDIFSDFIDPLYAFVVDDNFEIFRLVGVNDSCEDID